MALSQGQRTRTAFELTKELPTELLSELSSQNKIGTLKDVSNTLAENNTPGWLFYYISEEQPREEVVGKYLLPLIDDEIIIEEVTKEMNSNGVTIDLRNPASLNGMSENPMEPFRKEFINKKQAVRSHLERAIKQKLAPLLDIQPETVDPISEDNLTEFSEDRADTLAEELNYVRLHYEKQTDGETTASDLVINDHLQLTLLRSVVNYCFEDLSKEQENQYMEEYSDWYWD